MTDSSMTHSEYLNKVGVDPNGDFLREGLRLLAQLTMELEVSKQIGAGKYERTGSRTTQRNGYRDRDWDTRVGSLTLQIPKLRQGSYFPSLLEPRRRVERALLNVVQQAYVAGVSTRRVDELVQALGLDGIDKSTVSRACQELDEEVTAFRNRPLTAAYPYVWLDALYLKVRQDHRIVSQAAVIAIGVRETGEREVLGLALGAAESEPFWLEFLRQLVARGLHGVQLVTSDSHERLLRYGRPAPDYARSDPTTVVVQLSSAQADIPFLQMVIAEEERTGVRMPLDSLIVLARLRKERRLDVQTTAAAIQKNESVARAVLERLA